MASTRNIEGEHARPQEDSAGMPLTLWHAASMLMPQFSHHSSDRLVSICDDVQERCLAMTLSAGFFEAISRAIQTSRELAYLKYRNKSYEIDHDVWWDEFAEEKAQLVEQYERLMSYAIKNPSLELCRQIDIIPRHLEVIDQAATRLREDSKILAKQTEAKRAEYRYYCQELISYLLPCWVAAGYTAPFQKPDLPEPQYPFDEGLLDAPARCEEAIEQFFQRIDRAQEPVDDQEEDWAPLLGLRVALQRDVQMTYQDLQQHRQRLKFFDYEREMQKKHWREQGSEAVEELEARMVISSRDLKDDIRKLDIKLEVTRRRAAFMGLRLDATGNQLNDEDEQHYINPEEEGRRPQRIRRWAEEVPARAPRAPLGKDEREFSDPDVPALEDWRFRPVGALDSHSQAKRIYVEISDSDSTHDDGTPCYGCCADDEMQRETRRRPVQLDYGSDPINAQAGRKTTAGTTLQHQGRSEPRSRPGHIPGGRRGQRNDNAASRTRGRGPQRGKGAPPQRKQPMRACRKPKS